MNDIVITFDSIRKDSNKTEYRMVNRASCHYNGSYYASVGDGDNMKKLLALVHWIEGDFSALVHVMRGDTRVFEEVPLKAWLFPPKQKLNDGLAAYQESRKETQ